MAVRMVLHVFRKPGMTFDDFSKHYEEVHVPLMKEIAADLFPLAHIRRYITRAEPNGNENPTQQVSGDSNAIHFDALAELIFRDMDHFVTFSGVIQGDQWKETVADDCAKFMDAGKTVTLLFQGDDAVETKSV